LASCVTTRVKASRSALLEALRGHVSAHHRFMLKLRLAHIGALDGSVATSRRWRLDRESGQGRGR